MLRIKINDKLNVDLILTFLLRWKAKYFNTLQKFFKRYDPYQSLCKIECLFHRVQKIICLNSTSWDGLNSRPLQSSAAGVVQWEHHHELCGEWHYLVCSSEHACGSHTFRVEQLFNGKRGQESPFPPDRMLTNLGLLDFYKFRTKYKRVPLSYK